MNKDDLGAIKAGDISLSDIKTAIRRFRTSQEYCAGCKDHIQAFLKPTLDLAGDMIFDICDEKGIDPSELEDTDVQTIHLKPNEIKGLLWGDDET